MTEDVVLEASIAVTHTVVLGAQREKVLSEFAEQSFSFWDGNVEPPVQPLWNRETQTRGSGEVE